MLIGFIDMSTTTIVELIGYLGSILVLFSFLMPSVVKLRVINSVGSAIFTIYALIIHSYPTAVMNFCLVLVNLYYLRRIGKEKHYELLSVASQDRFLTYLLRYYQKDIESCFPGLNVDLEGINRAYIICCDASPAGILLGTEREGILNIMLDYSMPAYRDCSIGQYLIWKLPQDGLRRLLYSGPVDHHMAYLSKLGFEKRDGVYIKDLL